VISDALLVVAVHSYRYSFIRSSLVGSISGNCTRPIMWIPMSSITLLLLISMKLY